MTAEQYEDYKDEMSNENEEQQQDQYEEQDGQEQQVSAEDYQKLQAELEQLRKWQKKSNEEAKNYRLKAKAYEEAGFSPEELKELKEKEYQRQQKELERKGDFNKLKETLQTEFSEKEKQYQSRIEQLQSSMEKTLIQRDVTSAIAKYEGIQPLLQPHVERSVKLMENDDGSMVARVVDADGNPEFNGKGDYLTVDEFVASLREHDDFGAAFRGRGQSGSGTRQAHTEVRKAGKTGLENKPRSQWTQADRQKFRDVYGDNWIEEYEKIPL